jgi:hypothetical protein
MWRLENLRCAYRDNDPQRGAPTRHTGPLSFLARGYSIGHPYAISGNQEVGTVRGQALDPVVVGEGH